MKSMPVAIALALILAPLRVFAHATPVLYEPGSSAVVTQAPKEIMIRFSERIEEKTSSIRVLRQDGSKAESGIAFPDPDDAHAYRAYFKESATGSYTVVWQVVSADDGHFTKGAYAFAVGKGNAPENETAQFQVIHSSTGREAFSVGLELVGQAILLGMIAMVLLLLRARKRGESLPLPSGNRMTVGMLIGVGCIVTGVIMYLLVKAGDLSKVQDIPFPFAFRQFLTTVAGIGAAYRGGLALLFALIFFIARKSLLSLLPMGMLLAVILLSMFLRAKVSHAAASEWLPMFSIAINFTHLTAKSLWVGILMGIVFFIFPHLKEGKDVSLFSRVLTYSSKYLAIIFCITTVTGLYIIWLHAKEPANIGSSLWGARFLYLSGFAVLLVLFRLYHHFVVNTLAAKAKDRSPLFRAAGATVAMEMLVGITVLFSSAFLIITTPPLTHSPAVFGRADSQGLSLSLSSYAYDESLFLLTANGTADDVKAIRNISLTLTNAGENIGPIVAETEKRFDGGYVFPVSALSIPGTWKISATVQRPFFYDANADFSIDYPAQISEAKEHSGDRTFGGFEIVLVLAAVASILFSAFLYHHAANLETETQSYAKIPNETLPVLTFKKLWIACLFNTILLLIVIAFHVQRINASFRDACKRDGFYWHESVPMRDGKATSNKAMLGCSMGYGKGMFHITDAREFSYFDRPAAAVASLRITPEKIATGMPETLVFTVRDANGMPEKELAASHDRILHISIASDDLSVFDHIHVEDNGPVTEEMLRKGVFPATFVFPKAGRYIIGVDFTVRAQEFSQEFYVNAEGAPQTVKEPQADMARTQQFDGYTVTLNAPGTIRPRSGVLFSYTVEKDGLPVEDLQPYLAAPMHIAVMREDLRFFSHVHGQLPRPFLDRIVNLRTPMSAHMNLPDIFGPTIEAGFLFPTSGRYVIFGEFIHKGKRVVTKFWVDVR